MRSPLLACMVLCFGVACSGPSPNAKLEIHVETPTPPDESTRFPQTGLVRMDRIPNHLLDASFMPGGNLATYKNANVIYRQFLGKMPDAQAAAFLLIDWRKKLKDAKYLPNMGGYYGSDAGEPVYVFVKGPWVAGTVGLPEGEADVVARQFAARL